MAWEFLGGVSGQVELAMQTGSNAEVCEIRWELSESFETCQRFTSEMELPATLEE